MCVVWIKLIFSHSKMSAPLQPGIPDTMLERFELLMVFFFFFLKWTLVMLISNMSMCFMELHTTKPVETFWHLFVMP